MADNKGESLEGLSAPPLNRAAVSAAVPLNARLAHEIPKPKDWQAFQRLCVLLFQAELNDPHAQEYGRVGQNQRGIDVLGKRNGNPDYYVGIQCRHIARPLKEPDILKECRAALALKAALKEIIFATTAPDDTGATDAAITVERTLRSEGNELTVVVYGWQALQNKIAVHDVAYAAFYPSIVATSARQTLVTSPPPEAWGAEVAAQVVDQLRQIGVALAPREISTATSKDEDPALHAKIDTFRDLVRDENQPLLAEKGLLALVESESLSGKPWAHFRIETNLGAIAFALGRQAGGAARFEAAYAIRPDDPNAVANLALARLIQDRCEEAMELARQALEATPRAEHAVEYLLSAAARSIWQGEPETLIPPDLVGSSHADLGLVEFLRQRNIPGWAERSLELSRRHANVREFKQVRAIAVLAIALESDQFVPGGRGPVTAEDLNRAADDMKDLAEHSLEIGFANKHDLFAYLNNASVLLRLCGRHSECEALLRSGLPRVPNEPQLQRLLALAQAADGRRDEALATLAAGDDPESRLLIAELVALDDPAAALARALSVEPLTLSPGLVRLRWHLIGELALKTGDAESLQSAVTGLRLLDSRDVMADLLEILGERKVGLEDHSFQERLRVVASALPGHADMGTRYVLAHELCNQALPEEASRLLEEHVDLSRRSPVTTLYLQSLAAARRDEAFQRAIAVAAPAVRDDPGALWTLAAHAWNVGDLTGAYRAIEALLRRDQTTPAGARLLKIEILLRQDRSAELLAELDKPVEDLAWTRLQDRFRIASLLGRFGYIERAVAFAYRLFLEHRDKSQTWMTLSMLVLQAGQVAGDGPRPWNAQVVAPSIAVDLRYDNGEEVFFVVEPDATLRKLDEDAWEPDHRLVRILSGLGTGARFVDPTSGREGAITRLRHKYVARLQYVMLHYESRFPEIQGFRGVSVDVKQPGGLDKLIATLKTRHDWVEQEQEQYRNGPWPLGTLAHRLGADTIEVAAGLASKGIPLKVAIGDEPERDAAEQAIWENARKGCVLDLLAFWTASQLRALDTIAATCGRIHLTQSVMDRLRARREKIDQSAKEGLRWMRYDAGKLAVQEVAAEVAAKWRADLECAIAWAEGNATMCPLVAGEELPPELREHLRAGWSDILDSVVLAIQTGVLLVTDDLHTREISRLVSGKGGAWLHPVFSVALNQRRIDFDTYVRWSAQLVDGGHNYIGITGPVLVRALHIDAEAGGAPRHLFKTLSKMIGGRDAEPQSHIVACLSCLQDLWSHHATFEYRQAATGLLLRQLVLRERNNDYRLILQTLLQNVQNLPRLVEYIHAWARGHFIPEAL